MNNIFFIPVAVVYFLVTGLLFLFGLNFLYMTYLSLREKPEKLGKPRGLKEWPLVTVQLPIFNERYVAETLVDAAAALDYPSDRLEIQVLDDSTDETFEIVKRAVKRAKDRGLDINHIHRTDRQGYKAGALRDGFADAKGEFCAIFDADFRPQRDFLKRTIPHFEDPKIAFVQTRWGHTNRNFSFLTLVQALAIDAHFMVEQLARSRGGFWFNFNGTAGVWRRTAIEDAGGWNAETLTEDLDLSYRAFLKGWRARFLSMVETPAELPITFNAFRRQQHRWARGSLECAIKLLPRIWKGNYPLRNKLASTFHLSGYGVHLLLFLYVILYPLVILLSGPFPELISVFGLAYVFSLTSLAPTLLFFTGQFQLGRPWWHLLPLMLLISAFGAGMMLNTVRASFEIINRKPSEFRRTPKFGQASKDKAWMKNDYHLKLDPIVYWELAFSVLSFFTVFLGSWTGYSLISVYSGLFGIGFAFTSLYTIFQTISINRMQQARRPTEMQLALGVNSQKLDLHACDLKTAILYTLAYSDIFDFPLSLKEIHRYLIGYRATEKQISDSLQQLAVDIFTDGERYALASHSQLFAQRKERSWHANELWNQSLRFGAVIAQLPFVRMVAVTGALASDNVDVGADLDYLIVTKPGYLWLTRAMILALDRIAARRGQQARLCPNFLISEKALALEDRDLFTAQELVRMVPIAGLDTYDKMRAMNAWTDDFLPNAQGIPNIEMNLETGGPMKTTSEFVLSNPATRMVEKWEMRRKMAKFASQQAANGETRFSADFCKGHFDGHKQQTMLAFEERIAKLKLNGK